MNIHLIHIFQHNFKQKKANICYIENKRIKKNKNKTYFLYDLWLYINHSIYLYPLFLIYFIESFNSKRKLNEFREEKKIKITQKQAMERMEIITMKISTSTNKTKSKEILK